jgi:hypothetical protein
VWDQLDDRHKDVLLLLVNLGTYRACYEALGIKASLWYWRIGRAREEARRLWFAPEVPSRHFTTDRPGARREDRKDPRWRRRYNIDHSRTKRRTP